jgi:hypothetical protein
MKRILNNVVFLAILSLLLIACATNKKRGSWENKNFETYLENKKISFEKQKNGYLYTDSIESLYDKYYSDFLKYEKKLKLEANPYLKINKVYVHYRTPTSVEFSVYSDEGTFCLSTFDLDIDGKILSFPENGVIKVLEPIKVVHFGRYEITGNVLKTRKRRETLYDETYYYVNGTIKNDTIHYTERYIGKEKKFEKKFLAKTHKSDIKEIYQPNLKARKYKNFVDLTCFEVTGEFSIEQ